MHGALPARDRTQRQLRKDRDVDQARIVPLHQHDVRVEAPQVVDDEALQRPDVLDLLNREDVEINRGDPRGDPHGVLRVLSIHQTAQEGAGL